MTADYSEAGTRHFKDGALLQENRRLPNADQLFGFAAECAIKSALVAHAGCLDGGALAKAYHKHVNELWDLVPVHGIQKRYGALVAVLKALPRVFANWSTDQRYGADCVVVASAVAAHRKAAARVLGSVGLCGIRGEG